MGDDCDGGGRESEVLDDWEGDLRPPNESKKPILTAEGYGAESETRSVLMKGRRDEENDQVTAAELQLRFLAIAATTISSAAAEI